VSTLQSCAETVLHGSVDCWCAPACALLCSAALSYTVPHCMTTDNDATVPMHLRPPSVAVGWCRYDDTLRCQVRFVWRRSTLTSDVIVRGLWLYEVLQIPAPI